MKKSNEEITILASGAFDLLHYGHLYYLESAKKVGGKDAKLVVVVARDATVKRLKGHEPIIPEQQRLDLVRALRIVDNAILGYEDMDFQKIIEEVQPNIIALGYDEEITEKKISKVISERNLEVSLVRINKFREKETLSSSKIKRKIIEKYEKSVNDDRKK